MLLAPPSLRRARQCVAADRARQVRCDLLAWHRALLAGDPIPSDLVALMEKPHVQVDDTLWSGYGVEVRETYGRRETSHRGGTDGFRSYFIRFPDGDPEVDGPNDGFYSLREAITAG